MFIKLALEEALFHPTIQLATKLMNLADGFWLLKMEIELPSSSTIWIPKLVSLSSNDYFCEKTKQKETGFNE